MMTKEEYKREIVRMWDSIRDDEYKGTETCAGVTYCDVCPLYTIGCESSNAFIGCGESSNAFEMIEVVEKWSKEHPPKKFKVSKLEFDILEIYYVRDREWHIYEILEDEFLSALFKEGYFKGATRNMTIEKYLRNCEVKEDV